MKFASSENVDVKKNIIIFIIISLILFLSIEVIINILKLRDLQLMME